MSTLEVSNELSDRERRNKNIVLHNVPENDDPDKDVDTVENILGEILYETPDIQRDLRTKKARVYRLGAREAGKARTIKCHLNSKKDREQILVHSRILLGSENFRNVIVQADLTPMQRRHIKELVMEKKRRNCCAKENNEEPDWIVRNGKLCRKSDVVHN